MVKEATFEALTSPAMPPRYTSFEVLSPLKLSAAMFMQFSMLVRSLFVLNNPVTPATYAVSAVLEN